jgi:aspartate kinase
MTGKIAVGGITRTDGLVMIRVLGAASSVGMAGSILSALGNAGINVTCVTSFVDRAESFNLCFAVKKEDLDQTLGLLQSHQDEMRAANIEYQSRCSAISIYGPHFSERPAIAGAVFSATAEAGVDILMINTSYSTVSFLTGEDQAVLAVQKLQEKFLVP